MTSLNLNHEHFIAPSLRHETSSGSQYLPLNSDTKEIRLLQLQPGNYSDPIIISLRHEPIYDDAIQYDALSHVWGKEISYQDAVVNGYNVPITANLDCVLRYLRSAESEKNCLLWIDALSINQEDVKERNRQVRMMGTTYRSANTVIIWLGPTDDDDLSFALGCMTENNIPRKVDRSQNRLLRGLTLLCTRPWFRRVWTVQEFILARDPVIQVGHTRVSWSHFLEYLENVADQYVDVNNGHDTGHRSTLPKNQTDLFWQAWRTPFTLNLLRTGDEIFATFYGRLLYTRERLASDPRDKIFGLAGISNFEEHESILPDYSSTTAQVFSETTRLLLLNKTYFAYLGFPLYPLRNNEHPAKDSGRVADLPSWALDLSVTSPATVNQIPLYNHPWRMVRPRLRRDAIEPRTQGFVRFSPDCRTMFAAGVLLGTIVGVCTRLSDHKHEKPDQALSVSTVRLVYEDMIRPGAALSETLVRDLVSYSFELTQHVDEIKALLHGKDVDENKFYPFLRKLSKIGDRRTLFVTKEGRTGSTYHPDPKGVRPGDLIVGLFGRNIPFILRSASRAGSEGQGDGEEVYRMVNLAYVTHEKWSHPFVESAPMEAGWEDFKEWGMREWKIV